MISRILGWIGRGLWCVVGLSVAPMVVADPPPKADVADLQEVVVTGLGNALLVWANGQAVGQSSSGVGAGYTAFGRSYVLGLAYRF